MSILSHIGRMASWLALAAVLVTVPVVAQEVAPATYLSSPALLDKGLAELRKRTGPNPKVSRILIEPDRITLLTQGRQAAYHVDQWAVSRLKLLILETHTVTGPTAYRDPGIVAETERSFFPMDEVALGDLQAVLAAALERAALEQAAAVTSVTIERQISLLPRPRYGEVRWNIAVASPRESATVFADAAGRIYAADLSNTSRAQRLNLIEQDDWPMADAQRQLAEIVGSAAVVHQLRVYESYLHVEVDSPDDASQARSYSWDYSGVRRGIVDTPSLISVGMRGTERFALAELDLTLLPRLKAAALAAFDSPGARITFIEARRETDRPGLPEVLWYIDLKQADGQEGDVIATASGEIVTVVLPESRRAVQGPWNGPEVLVQTLAEVGRTFGADTRFSEITLSSNGVSAKIEDPQAPGQLAEFVVDGGRISRFGFGPSPFDSFDEQALFTLADLAPLDAETFATLSERVLARMQMEGLEVSRLTISRTPFMFDSRGETFVEIRAEKDDGWTGGRAAYAIDDGEELDVVLP